MLERKIQYFIDVVQEGSFSSAAKKYLLSQSAISQQITQLEMKLVLFYLIVQVINLNLRIKEKSFMKDV